MAELIVGNLNFGIALLRTASLDVEPIMDDSGKDFLCARVVLHVSGIVNSVTIATGKDGVSPVEGTPGDSMPVTIGNVRDYLMIPRAYVKFSIGGTTVLESPERNSNGDYLSCDVRGGPFPKSANFTHFSGIKSCYLTYSVETYVTYSNSVLLSNRWRLRQSTDQHGVVRRVVTGKAVFRKDYLDYLGPLVALDGEPFQADDFRQFLFIPCDTTARRVGVEVGENEDGSEVDYTVTDADTRYGLGSKSDAVEVVGTVTVGQDLPIKDLKGGLSFGMGFTGDLGRLDPKAALDRVFASLMPTTRVVGQARAVGRLNSSQYNLANTALNILLDRLYPAAYDPSTFPAKGGALAACYCTFNVDSDHAPFAEVRIEVISFTRNIIGTMFDFKKVTSIIKADNTYNLLPNVDNPPTNPTFADAGFVRPVLLSSGNTRGTDAQGSVTARLVAQTLRTASEAYDLPDEPPSNQPAEDSPTVF